MKTPAKKATTKKAVVKKATPLMQGKKPVVKKAPVKKVEKKEEEGFLSKVKRFGAKLDNALQGTTTTENETFMGRYVGGARTGQKATPAKQKVAMAAKSYKTPAKMKKC